MLVGAYVGATESSGIHRDGDLIFLWLRGYRTCFVVEFPFFAQNERWIFGVAIQQPDAVNQVASTILNACVGLGRSHLQ